MCRLSAINGTGDQLFGNRQLLLKYLRLLALSQQAQGQYVGPGLVEQRLYETRDFFSFQPVADFFESTQPCQHQSFLAACRIEMASFTDLGLACDGLHGAAEVLQQVVYDIDVAIEPAHPPIA